MMGKKKRTDGSSWLCLGKDEGRKDCRSGSGEKEKRVDDGARIIGYNASRITGAAGSERLKGLRDTEKKMDKFEKRN